jgi:uncharacterized protein YecE (DUF72 family)
MNYLGERMTEFYLGTMGFSYGDWKGVFYPSGVPARDYLTYYGRIFNAVEMDTTFYAIPRPTVVQGWSDAVPVNFRFTAKTPQLITHEMGLLNVGPYMDEFINTIRFLGDKLGVVLIQLPPNYTIDKLPILTAFLKGLPVDIRFAVEFRHSSWYTTQIADLLAAHRICWAATEYADLPHQVTPTVDFIYIRWLGKHAAFRHYDHEQVDREQYLAWWGEQIKHNLDHAQIVYGFFNNDFSGFAPATCNRIKTLLGLTTVDYKQPVQGRLF